MWSAISKETLILKYDIFKKTKRKMKQMCKFEHNYMAQVLKIMKQLEPFIQYANHEVS